MDAELGTFEQLEAQRRAKKISRRDARGYREGAVCWKTHKSIRFRCHICKKSFDRMEVLLQHFRDSNRHSADPLAQQASKQLADWLAAKDSQKHCCATCCLGFDSHIELLVHLRNTAVHKGTPEAEQAASLLLPKDEARFLRRDLQGSATKSASSLGSPESIPPTDPGAAQQKQGSTKPAIVWQVLSAEELKSVQIQGKKTGGCPAASVRQGVAAEGKQHVTHNNSSRQCAADIQVVKPLEKQSNVPATSGGGVPVAAVGRTSHGKRDASAMLGEQSSPPDATATAPVKTSGTHANGSFRQPDFVQSLHRRTVFKKPGVTQPMEACVQQLGSIG